jgi:UDP-glucose 4-epimerase
MSKLSLFAKKRENFFMNSIKNSRILVTGGAGFVGSFIVDQLLEDEVKEVIIVDNFFRGSLQNIEKALDSQKVHVIEGDIRDTATLNKAFQGIDYCFHMAALRITRCAEFPKEALDVMIEGTYNVIDCCLRHGIKKLVAASSASIYGTADTFPTTETHHPYNNRTLYGALNVAHMEKETKLWILSMSPILLEPLFWH